MDRAKDISVPPEFVKPCITPTMDKMDIRKKLILNLILSFSITKNTEKIITIETKILKLI